MLMADDGSNLCQTDMFTLDEDIGNENLCIDLGELFHMLNESPESAQKSPEEQPLNGYTQESPNLGGTFSPSCDASSSAISPSFNFETSVLTGTSHGFSGPTGLSNDFIGPAGMSNGFCDHVGMSNNICDHVGNSNGVKLETFLKSESPVHSFCGSLGEWMDPSYFYVGKEAISCHDLLTGGGALDCKGTENGRLQCNETFSFAIGNFDASTTKTDFYSFDCPNVITGSHTNFFDGDYLTEDVPKQHFLRENAFHASGVPDINGISVTEPNFSLPSEAKTMPSMFFPSSGQFTQDNLEFKVADGCDGKMANLSNEVKVSSKESIIVGGVSLACGIDSYRWDNRFSNLVQNPEVFDFVEEEKCVVHESKRPHIGPRNYDGSPSGISILSSFECLQNEQNVESSCLLPSNITKEQVSNIALDRCWKAKNIPDSVRADISGRCSNISSQKIEKNPLAHSDYCNDNDDADLCILEEISAPARPTVSSSKYKSLVAPQCTLICDSFDSTTVGQISMKPKSKEEHSIFQAALQVTSLKGIVEQDAS